MFIAALTEISSGIDCSTSMDCEEIPSRKSSNSARKSGSNPSKASLLAQAGNSSCEA